MTAMLPPLACAFFRPFHPKDQGQANVTQPMNQIMNASICAWRATPRLTPLAPPRQNRLPNPNPKQRSELHEAIVGGAWRSLHRVVALSRLRRASLLHLHLRDQRRLLRQPPARRALGG